ncbi:MAG: ATP-binding protein [Gammaproteobacteria bacterium]|nr:ATP-binding protein [Gammaproteobacteria bacterium]
MSTLSLKNRLLISAVFTLIAFLGLAGFALEQAFIPSAKGIVKEHLRAQRNALLTMVSIPSKDVFSVQESLPESRLTLPNSGLYAVILDQAGNIIWRSRSSVGIALDIFGTTATGRENFYQVSDDPGSPFYYSYGVEWEYSPDTQDTLAFTLGILHESREYRELIRSHRNELIFWLGLAGTLLLVMQLFCLGWGLKPLAEVMEELDRIERLQQPRIRGVYPTEIAQLSQRINLFIENERKNLKRYRNTLEDLAHSLKTPLAVIRVMTENREAINRQHIRKYVKQMSRIVDYQLNRAAASQFSVMHTAVDVQALISKVNDTLQNLYADKNIDSGLEIESGSVFYGDGSDFYELAGNIMDNAYKWAGTRVRVVGSIEAEEGKVHQGICLEVHDDGPGIHPSERDAVLKRGARVDQHAPGQGIGLAVAQEIVLRYRGTLSIHDSPLGGARVRVRFPSV